MTEELFSEPEVMYFHPCVKDKTKVSADVKLKKALNVPKGSAVPNRDKVAKITRDQARAIAKNKVQDMNANDLEAATNCVLGTARSMGIELVNG